MKKLITISLSIVLMASMYSCKKASPVTVGTSPLTTPIVDPLPVTDPLYPVGRVPLSFTQKGILEEVTGEWCGNCPDGALKMHDLISAHPNTVYGVAFHERQSPSGPAEPFEVTGAFDGLISEVFPDPAHPAGTIGFPSASVNRSLSVSLPDYLGAAFDYRDVWANQMSPVLKRTAPLGIAMVAAEDNDVVDLDVFVGYNANITGNTKLTVYEIEDDVQESAVGAQTSGGGTAALPYFHQHVLRKVVSANSGDAITLDSKDHYTKVHYNFNIAGTYHKKDNVKLIAMINVGATLAKDINVLNTQQVILDETKKWD